MSSIELPSRAKPEALHTLCRHLRGKAPVDPTGLYDELEIDRRQIRASIDYGSKLEFLESTDDSVTLGDRGRVISYNESLEESAVQDVFREAIESFKPYRETVIRIHANDAIEDIGGDPCIVQSSFKSAVQKTTGKSHSNRKINLLIKTLQAAGLGEFITGRRGKETRLRVNEEFEKYAETLAKNYDLPDMEEEENRDRDIEAQSSNHAKGLKGAKIRADTGSGELELELTLDVTDKSKKEIAEIIEKIRNGEI